MPYEYKQEDGQWFIYKDGKKAVEKGYDSEEEAKRVGALRTRQEHMAKLVGLEVLKTGSFVDMHGKPVTFTEADLDRVVDNHTEDVPVILGHEENQARLRANARDTSEPAAGWVHRLYRVGSKLLADVRYIPASVATWINNKVYRKVSSGLAKDFNGTSGFTLRHVGLLGATAPAVKGLEDIPVALATGALTVVQVSLAELRGGFSMSRAQAIEKLKALGVPELFFSDARPDDEVIALATALKPAPTEDSSALVAKLSAKVDQFLGVVSKAQDDLEAKERARRVTKLDEAIELAVKEERMAPAEKDHFRATALAIVTAPVQVQLADGKKADVLDTLLASLVARPKLGITGEKTPGEGDAKDPGPREKLIALATKDYQETPILHKSLSLEQYVEGQLLDNGFEVKK